MYARQLHRDAAMNAREARADLFEQVAEGRSGQEGAAVGMHSNVVPFALEPCDVGAIEDSGAASVGDEETRPLDIARRGGLRRSRGAKPR